MSEIVLSRSLNKELTTIGQVHNLCCECGGGDDERSDIVMTRWMTIFRRVPFQRTANVIGG